MNDPFEIFSKMPLITIFNDPDIDGTVKTARALAAGGLIHGEVLLRSRTAWEIAEALIDDGALSTVSVGTIAKSDDLETAALIGADACISAWLDPVLVRKASELGMLYFPTVETSTEAAKAHALGCRYLKLFPAEVSGGSERLRLLSGVYPDLKFIATGGIGPENLADYLALDCVLAVGGSWFIDKALVKAERWQEIEELARNTRALL